MQLVKRAVSQSAYTLPAHHPCLGSSIAWQGAVQLITAQIAVVRLPGGGRASLWRSAEQARRAVRWLLVLVFPSWQHGSFEDALEQLKALESSSSDGVPQAAYDGEQLKPLRQMGNGQPGDGVVFVQPPAVVG